MVGRADGLCDLYHSAGIPVVYGAARVCVVEAVGQLVVSMLSPACILCRFGLLLGTLLLKSKACHSLCELLFCGCYCL